MKNAIKNKINELYNNKEFYTVVLFFVSLLGFSFWLISVIINGQKSGQWNNCFFNFDDYMADLYNIIGYSGKRDVYNCEVHTGLGEKAYPPLTYVFTYMLSRLYPSMEKYPFP